jgi:16S rRNA (guanine527-N7)-methyltransferase
MTANADIKPSLEPLGKRFGLSGEQLERLERVVVTLASDKHAPTAIKEPGFTVDLHLADSLVALELGLVREAGQIADVGAGAGFPGIPLAVALPHSKVKLVESQARKCAFIERVEGAAGIENAEVVCSRVEAWSEGIGVHDVVLARAVAAQPIVLEYAAPLLRLGGAVVDWRGKRDLGEELLAGEVAELLGLRRDSIRWVEPYEGVRDHHLHVYVKVRETPDRFPRRVGVAAKKPLTATPADRGRR